MPRNDLPILQTIPHGEIFQPCHNLIVIEPVDSPDRTPGGIVLPQSAQLTESVVGKVLRVGEGNHNLTGSMLPMTSKVGDVVLIHPMAVMHAINEGGRKLLVLNDNDVMMKIEKDANATPLRTMTVDEIRPILANRRLPLVPFQVLDAQGTKLFDSTADVASATLALQRHDQSNPAPSLTSASA